jgi:hypothetical protein
VRRRLAAFEMRASADRSRGALVAGALASAWRHSPTELENSGEELAEVTPLLLLSGAGALGWWRVRQSNLRASQAAEQLQEAYRLHTIRAALRERAIKEILETLRAAKIEPILVKGWAIARIYPEKGLRPYGDIDLCVPSRQYNAAAEALIGPDGHRGAVDLHDGFAKLDEASTYELYARSHLVPLDDLQVRVLSPEDHLRILCLHMLRHGIWKPLWLCDIALAVESRAKDFDWGQCLTANRKQADWVACAIGLAHRLLGARVDDTPAADRSKRLPAWMLPTVLEQWGRPYASRESISNFRRQPLGILRELRHHWPNAIEGTVGVRGSFNELPRFPFQLGDVFLRTAKFLAQVPRSLR